ncbi:MAG: class I SAM-dependent rRNA methyltransferase [Desulfobacterota bacterium]|nr:class I SAM-dependent rRNA methyltransferase [Thermodesulfobacteriota bacterium]MDW8002509.1 class I SAM-dependent rRNA methyltransferase [Deltaproteobacteria bacterium]
MIPLVVKKEKIGPILARHPWVYSKALLYVPDGLRPGTPVKLVDESGKFIATGYFNSYSQISVRVWGYDESEKVDRNFFKKRIANALWVRKRYVENTDTNAYRLVNSEGDMLPGLVVDKYADYLVIQFHTKGMDQWRNEIIEALEEIVRPKGIYERSEIYTSQNEKPEEKYGAIRGKIPDLIKIRENGLNFLVDLKRGQKTGFFLDQRDKRKAFLKYARDAKVLNCFSYTGGFAVYALAGGAKSVINIDTSSDALELAKENVRINGFKTERMENIKGDVKKVFRDHKETYDAIVLDPPAFIKERTKKERGVLGYRYINRKAMDLLIDGGILVTCSCSYHLGLEEFRRLLIDVATKAKSSFRILEVYTHGIDHPVPLPFVEGEYLKCFFLQCFKN